MPGVNERTQSETVSFGPFKLSFSKRLLEKDGKPHPLGARALDILIVLAQRAGDVVSNREILGRVWANCVVEDGNLRFHVAALRKALGDGQSDARYVINVPGRGYCLVAPVTQIIEPNDIAAGVMIRPLRVPPSLVRMLGRDVDVGQISGELLARRFVTIVGPGGIGKTSVAVEVCHRLVATFHGAIHFVDLSTLRDGRLVISALSSAAGFTFDPDHALDSLVSSLADQPTLFVLDSCEHVIDDLAALAEAVFRRSPEAYILATSRESLRVRGEHIYRLLPLECPPARASLTMTELLAYPAAQLFVELVDSHTYHELGDADTPAIVGICRKLDGIPLAIELAAGRVDAYGIDGVLELLNSRFELLWHGRRTAAPRHQTLQATLDWSYELLPVTEREVAQRLAVFVGSFTLDAARSVAAYGSLSEAHLVEALAELVARSFLMPSCGATPVQYRMLDTTRDYLLAKLLASNTFDAVAIRHAHYFRTLLERAFTEYDHRNMEDWLANYGPETGNVRAALDWTFSATGDANAGMELTVAAIPLWFQLSYADECRHRVHQAIASSAAGTERDAHSRQIMQLYAALGLSRTFTKGHAPQALLAWGKALEIAEQLDDREFRLESLWGLWYCHIGSGEYRAALDTAHHFHQLAGSPRDRYIGDRLIGVPLHCMGDHAIARRHIERSFQSEASAPVPSGSIRFRYGQPMTAGVILAQMLWLQGFPEQAQATARSSVEIARRSGHAISVCDALSQASCPVAMYVGDLAAAEQAIQSLFEHARLYSLEGWEVLGRCWHSALQIRRGELHAGLAMLHNEVAELRKVRFAFYTTGFMCTLAEGLAQAGDTIAALRIINDALERCQQREELWCIAELLRVKGVIMALAAQADADAADEYFRQALEWARKQGALSWELRAATSQARHWALNGREQSALAVLSPILARFTEGYASADLETARKLLAKLSFSS
jgi:predicted ATPase/DNA-binding winged helix-turn-helix (wHTH) protein